MICRHAKARAAAHQFRNGVDLGVGERNGSHCRCIDTLVTFSHRRPKNVIATPLNAGSNLDLMPVW